jgi:hypothetical protein
MRFGRSELITCCCQHKKPSDHRSDRHDPTGGMSVSVVDRPMRSVIFPLVRHHRPVIVELLGAIRHLHASFFADELVMRAFVRILKSSPSANVVDQDMVEIGTPGLNVFEELDESGPVLDL